MEAIAAALRWLLGIFFGLMCIGLLWVSPAASLIVAIAALVAIPPVGEAIGKRIAPLARSRNQVLTAIGLFLGGFLVGALMQDGTASKPVSATVATTTPRASAAELAGNFQSRLGENNSTAALTIGRTLLQRYPGSPQAKAIEPQLAALQLKADADRKQAVAKQQEAARIAEAGKAKETAEAKDKFAREFASLKRERDEVAGITFYYDRNVPMSSVANFFGLYLGVPDKGTPYLRWKFMYTGADWLFIESMVFNIDGEKVGPIEFPFGAIERDNSGGRVWEWRDEALSSDDQILPFVRISASKKTLLRLQGRQYRKDREISSREKAAMLKMLDVYAGLKQWGVPK